MKPSEIIQAAKRFLGLTPKIEPESVFRRAVPISKAIDCLGAAVVLTLVSPDLPGYEERKKLLEEIVEAVLGGYSPKGVREWFQRPCYQLGEKSAIQVMLANKKWEKTRGGQEIVRAARWLAGPGDAT